MPACLGRFTVSQPFRSEMHRAFVRCCCWILLLDYDRRGLYFVARCAPPVRAFSERQRDDDQKREAAHATQHLPLCGGRVVCVGRSPKMPTRVWIDGMGIVGRRMDAWGRLIITLHSSPSPAHTASRKRRRIPRPNQKAASRQGKQAATVFIGGGQTGCGAGRGC